MKHENQQEILDILAEIRETVDELIENYEEGRVKMINVYVAGPLFNEADMAQRIREGVALRNALEHIPEIDGYEVFNPIESDVNFKVASPTAEIFNIDNTFIPEDDAFLLRYRQFRSGRIRRS